MLYDFDQIVDRTNVLCEKWGRREEIFGREDIIPLWVADMDFGVSEPIQQAIKRRAEHPTYGYSFRDDDYYNAVISWVDRRNGWSVDRQDVSFVPGVVVGFTLAINAFSCAGDGVVINTPVYPPFARMIRANGRKVVESPLVDVNGRFEFDFEDLDRKLQDAKVLLFCNPHNPTGRVFTREELMKVGQLCLKHNVKIVSDEIHSDIVYTPHKHIHIASLSEQIADITMTLIAPSKTFNVPGLSTSVMIITNDTLRRAYRKEYDKLHIDQGNIFGSVVLKAAYGCSEEWLDQLLSYLQGNRDYIVDFIEENLPQLRCFNPEGTFLIWIDCREMGLDHDSLNRFLVEKAGLGLNEGLMFGQQGECCVRLNFATRRDLLKEALNRLKDNIKK